MKYALRIQWSVNNVYNVHSEDSTKYAVKEILYTYLF